ncbi:alpha/beta fold hydrolase [Actinosynnema sp. CS-041913]|uniref:alpha/beta fold hydrolase n=1 Tax=Actinosynnema sp. CS-041913 TaxID=3239917 RepID=UPI003D926FA7
MAREQRFAGRRERSGWSQPVRSNAAAAGLPAFGGRLGGLGVDFAGPAGALPGSTRTAGCVPAYEEVASMEHHHRARYDEVRGRRVRSLHAGDRRAGVPAAVVVPGLGVVEYLMNTAHGCAAWTQTFVLDVGRADLPAVAATVAAWLAAVPDAPVVLVGHSTGAQAALRAAVENPGAVQALVLLSPTFPPTLRRLPLLLPALLRDAAHEPLHLWRTVLPGCARIGFRTICGFLRSAQSDRPEETIAEVSCPVLVVRGEHDTFCPASWATRLGATARQGRAVTSPGAHGFCHQHGEHTAALIADHSREGR